MLAPAPAELSPAACGARLAELFPALFDRRPPLPLKLRIQADIQQRAPGIFTKKSLSGFLHRHTTGTAYLIALTQSAQRFDLDGAAAGDLAEEHRAAAVEELQRRRSLHDARRNAERAAHQAAHQAAQHAARQAQQSQQAQQAAVQREHAAEDGARRDRAQMLRTFESTTLTLANFCALKGIAAAELEATLALARREREERPAQPTPQPQALQRPRQDRPAPRTDERRGERHDEQRRRPRRPAPPRPG